MTVVAQSSAGDQTCGGVRDHLKPLHQSISTIHETVAVVPLVSETSCQQRVRGLLETRPSHVGYRAELGCSRANGVGVCS